MENKNTAPLQSQPAKPVKEKFTFLDHVKLAYCTISFFSVMIFAEAPFWIIALVVANFGISGLTCKVPCLSYPKIL